MACKGWNQSNKTWYIICQIQIHVRIIHFKWLQWWFEWFKGACALKIEVCDDATYPPPLFWGVWQTPLSHHLSHSASFFVLASSCSTLPVTISLSTHCFQLLLTYLLVYKKPKPLMFGISIDIPVRYCLLRHSVRKY